MNYEASNPADYPVGELVKKLPDDVRAWVLAQSLDTKSHIDIHQIMMQGRREMGLPPWHLFTAVMQAYAAAAFNAAGAHVDVSCSWFTCCKQPRPLDMYYHKYEDFHEIWVHTQAKEDILVGYVVGRYDGRPVFSFWDIRTERYIMDCTKPMIIYHPYTREPILSGHGLAKWRDHVSFDGRAILPEMSRRGGKKSRVRIKQPDPTMDIAPRVPSPLSETNAKMRLTLLKLFQSVIDRRIITDRVTNGVEVDDGMFEALCGVLRSSLDIYTSKLETRDVTVVHIPDDVFLACQTTVELLGEADGIGGALKLWMAELLKTDTTRG